MINNRPKSIGEAHRIICQLKGRIDTLVNTQTYSANQIQAKFDDHPNAFVGVAPGSVNDIKNWLIAELEAPTWKPTEREVIRFVHAENNENYYESYYRHNLSYCRPLTLEEHGPAVKALRASANNPEAVKAFDKIVK